jgi:hypothetical protein
MNSVLMSELVAPNYQELFAEQVQVDPDANQSWQRC